MSIIAMRVRAVGAHPDADALEILELQAPDVERLIVITNEQGRWSPGDGVVVARVGATLRDGTAIKKARLRGVDSFGMVLGPTDAEPGTDFTTEHGRPPEAETETEAETEAQPHPPGVSMVKWTSIEGLPQVRKAVRAVVRLDREAVLYPTLTYRAKVKLDGTNAGVHVLPDGRFAAQSRSRLLTPQSDNYGFAAWVHDDAATFFEEIGRRLGRAIVYGEWCGPGIQKNVAINRIERKLFAVFAIQLGDPAEDTARLVVDPERIAERLPAHPDVRVLPWHGEPVQLDFHDDAGLSAGVERINAMVESVEQVDPWVSEHFGIEGRGEGVVLYPVGGIGFDEAGTADRDNYTALMFKAKGESHRVNRQPKAVQVDPQVSAGVGAFVEQFVTPARLEQALMEGCDGERDMRRMGDFLRWVGRDVQKESVLELEASGLEWKQVAKAVAHRAQQWYRRCVAEG